MIYIKNFKDIKKADLGQVGGKSASLGEMFQNNILVPDGFVVTTDGFKDFLAENSLQVGIDSILNEVKHEDINSLEKASEKIHGLILNQSFPENLGLVIYEAYNNLGDDFVAVRSSATAEDGADHAWAGQLESFLNTDKENLLMNIKKCFASLFSPRAIFYRFEKKLNMTEVAVAVVVQKMIQSEVSGIAFSVHPVTESQDQIIIESSYGLGEAIVSGSVTPDSYVISKKENKVISENIAVKIKGLYKNQFGENVWKEIENNKQKESSLSQKQILELSKIIVKIENHYGFPCDIEWAFKENKFFTVQSRPITTLGNKNKFIIKEKWVNLWEHDETNILNFWCTPNGAMKRKDFYMYDKFASYFNGEKMVCYTNEESIKKTIEHGKNFLSTKYMIGLKKKYEKEQKVWWKFIRGVEKKNYEKLNNQIIAEDILKLFEYQSDCISYFDITVEGHMQALENLVRSYVSKVYNKEKVDEILFKLVTPTTFDDIQMEELDFLKIKEKIKSGKVISDKVWLKHVSNHPWLSWERENKKVCENMNSKMKMEKGEYKKVLKEKNNVNTKREKEAKMIIKEIYLETGMNLRKVIDTIHWISIKHMDMKKYWDGVFFLSRHLWEEASKRIGVDFFDTNYIDPQEFKNCLIDKNYCENFMTIMNDRKIKHMILFENGKLKFMGSADAQIYYENNIYQPIDELLREFKGQTAFPGVVRGKVRIIKISSMDNLQKDMKVFEKGDILVTSMTQPNIVPLMKKAGAIVTNEGGITCHAAIISRELGIPCIIGTKIATDILKDGDMVEVDANNGLIKVLVKN